MPDGVVLKITRAEELNSIGAELFDKGQLEGARLHFLTALAIEPNMHTAMQNLGAVLRAMGHQEAAASMARRSVRLSKGNAFARSNLGVAELALKNYESALVLLKGVLDDLPNSAHSWHNYGLVLYMLGRYEEALEVFNKALSIVPVNAQCESDRALTLLSLGKVQEGLAAYEVRWKLLYNSRVWAMGLPEWKGEDLKDKALLVHHEQGFGDSIMLSRFLFSLNKLGCRLTFAAPQELQSLFQRSMPFVKVVVLHQDLPIEGVFDYHTPLLSAMRWLGISSPKEINAGSYLFSKKMQQITLPRQKIKIGICWASGNHGPALVERRRVVPLTAFLPLSELQDVALISLQLGKDAKAIVENGLEGIVFDVSAKLEDFAATADVMQHLDLIISVDSAVAHLAGAIGKPCLMLSPYTKCWRWWDKDFGRPWYKAMRIFPQSQDGSWDKAMGEVTRTVEKRYILTSH